VAGVNSEEDARKAYLGLDTSVDKASPWDSPDSMPLPARTSIRSADGGSVGHHDRDRPGRPGRIANKEMRLFDALSNYSDDGKVKYGTDQAALPALNMSLKGIPNGTLDGSLNGSFMMSVISAVRCRSRSPSLDSSRQVRTWREPEGRDDATSPAPRPRRPARTTST
jgi:hypothetical protein